MRAPLVVRWPGHIEPGTVKNQMFASLDWLPTLVDIAGGPKDNELKAQIEKGEYPGIVKTTLDGVNQRAFLEGDGELGARHLLLLFRQGPVGGPLQELEDVLRDGVRVAGGLPRPAWSPTTGPRSSTSSAIRSRLRSAIRSKTLFGQGGALGGPLTAYVYDWNMLPIGQALWLRELETYVDYPPMQDPASYNLEQVVAQVKAMSSQHRAGE